MKKRLRKERTIKKSVQRTNMRRGHGKAVEGDKVEEGNEDLLIDKEGARQSYGKTTYGIQI